MVLAQEEARGLGHNYIGTEHLLLGLLREEEGLAARVLDALGIATDEVRSLVSRVAGREEEIATGRIPFTPHAKKVLELSLREALSLGHNYIGTEHVLLGLARANEGVATRVLLDFDVDCELVRRAMFDFLSGSATAVSEWQARKEGQEAKAAAAKPELAKRLAATRREKQRALAEGDFECVARARQTEAAQRRALLGLPDPPAIRSEPYHPESGAISIMSRRAPAVHPRSSAAPLVAGAIGSATALAIGLLLGYLIWH